MKQLTEDIQVHIPLPSTVTKIVNLVKVVSSLWIKLKSLIPSLRSHSCIKSLRDNLLKSSAVYSQSCSARRKKRFFFNHSYVSIAPALALNIDIEMLCEPGDKSSACCEQTKTHHQMKWTKQSEMKWITLVDWGNCSEEGVEGAEVMKWFASTTEVEGEIGVELSSKGWIFESSSLSLSWQELSILRILEKHALLLTLFEFSLSFGDTSKDSFDFWLSWPSL